MASATPAHIAPTIRDPRLDFYRGIAMFIIYIYLRARMQPELGPAMSPEDLAEYERISDHPLRLNYVVLALRVLVPLVFPQLALPP